MDYHVFILSRVKELVDHGTSAAAVMIAVFAIFASLRTLDIKQPASGSPSPCPSTRR